MWKSCSKCGKIHPENYKCNAGRIPRQRTDDQRFRSTNKWTEKSKSIRERSNWLCSVCQDEGYLETESLEVHHITKLTEAPELGLDDDNLVCLCKRHHEMADEGKIDPEYLRELARKRDEK